MRKERVPPHTGIVVEKVALGKTLQGGIVAASRATGGGVHGCENATELAQGPGSLSRGGYL